jgi:hypothetical protein
MTSIERVLGITAATVSLLTSPALAMPTRPFPVIDWTSADAVAAQRVAGEILATRLETDHARPVYDVVVRTPDKRLEDVQVDAHTARVIAVREVTDPGIIGEIEAP